MHATNDVNKAKYLQQLGLGPHTLDISNPTLLTVVDLVSHTGKLMKNGVCAMTCRG